MNSAALARNELRNPIATAFVALSLVFGTLFAFLTPPFQVPDEPSHYLRAYAISEGSFRVRLYDRAPAQPLPENLLLFATELVGSRTGDQRQLITVGEIRHALRYRLQPEKRVLELVPHEKADPVAFTAGGYPPLLYLPAAAGHTIGRALDLPLLVSFYVCRLLNLFASVAIGYAAVRIAPFGRLSLASIGLLPMTAFLRSSLSPDSLVISLALVCFAFAISAQIASRWRGRKDFRSLMLLTFVVATAKPLYLLLPALGLLAAFRNHKMQAGRVLAVGFTILTAAFATFLWVTAPLAEGSPDLELASRSSERHRSSQDHAAGTNLNFSAQMREIVENPGRFVRLVAASYIREAEPLAYQFAGRFGWLDTPFPFTLRMLLLIFLILAAFTDGLPEWSLRIWQRAVLVGSFFGTLIITATILYLVWTPVGAAQIEGLQGRYFIPIAPAILLALTSGRLSIVMNDFRRAWFFVALFSVALSIAAWSIASRFYGVVPSPVNYIAEGMLYPAE